MNRTTTGVLAATALALGLGLVQIEAQAPSGTVDSHVAAARAAAGQDHLGLFDRLCQPEPARPSPPAATATAGTPPRPPGPPARSTWEADAVKVFDNLSFVGEKEYSAWAVATSDGIIILDTIFEYSVDSQIVGGLKKLGLDPSTIKYALVSHGHRDHSGGAQYLQDSFKTRVLLSAADWDMLEKNTRDPSKPKRDLVVTDGQVLTLGDQQLTFYLTPGHTLGTVSTLVPVFDRGARHVAAAWGGTAFNFPHSKERFQTYIDSARRFSEIAVKAGADVLIANHTIFDGSKTKLPAMATRKPGDPHPYVIGTDSVRRYLKVAEECAVAAMLRLPDALAPERVAVIDRGLQRYVDDNRVAGVVAMVLQDGRPVYEKAFGWADKEAGRRMTTDTIFRIASQTKALTSVAIMQLIEEGRLSLGRRAGDFIPTFAKTTVATGKTGETVITEPARRPITIRDLLTHTAGISYGTEALVADLYQAKGLGPAAGAGWYTADKDEPVCTTMERLGTLPSVAQPGEKWVYGYNTDILGCIVEKVSGMPLDEYLRTRITAPLGMKDTQFFLPAADRARLSAVYASQDGTYVRAAEGPRGQGHYVDGPRKNFAGGAGLLSTARDYARFLEALRLGGTVDGVRLLSPRSVRLMATNQVGTLHSTTGLGFGLGFETTDRYGAGGMQSEGSFGWGGAYGSVYRIDPAEKLVMVLMIQLLPNSSDIREVFPTLVYQALQ